jgi:hypothetical protein
MNVGFGTVVAQFLFWEYLFRMFLYCVFVVCQFFSINYRWSKIAIVQYFIADCRVSVVGYN